MFVKKDVYKIEATKDAYAYAVRNSHGITLIDTHYPGKGEEIMAELRQAGLDKIDRILLTHNHIDHIGNVAYIHGLTGCDIWLSAQEKAAITDPALRSCSDEDNLLAQVALPLQALPGGSIAGIGIVPAYGHTWGHTCFLYEGVLFAGDLIAAEGGTLQEINPIYTKDLAQSRLAIEEVSDNTPFNLVCPAHGEPLACNELKLD